jgi:predicted MFS family arabinose efflux permease
MKNDSRKTAWIMWLVVSIFYAYQYILRIVPSVMLEDIMQQFNMNTADFGQFSGIYYIGYSLVHIPIGILLDKYGAKKIIPLCICISTIGVLPIVFAEQYIYPILGRMITGIGSSAAILGVFKIIRMSFSEGHFTRMLSFSVTIGLTGAIYGGVGCAYLRSLFAYKDVIVILAFVGIIIAIMSYFVIPEARSETADGNSVDPIFVNLKYVFLNKKVVITYIAAGLMVGPLEGFADIWGPRFLKQIYGLTDSMASYIISMIFIGMCFGAPILNFVTERIECLKTVILSGVIMLVVFLLLLTKILNSTALFVSFIFVGICCAYQILAIYKASTFVNPKYASLTTAVANMTIMVFGYVIHGSIGIIINMCNELPTSNAYCCGISVIPFALFLGIIGFTVVHSIDKSNVSTV